MKHYILILSLAIALTSCTHVHYSPNAANAPMFSETGESRVNLLYSSGNISQFNGGELQIAHAVSKNFGMMLNGMTAGRSDTWTEYGSSNTYRTERGNGSYIEIAGGYFRSFDERKRLIGEIYSGFGAGSVTNDYDYGNHSKVTNSKFFVQPSIGYKSKFFEAAFVPKISFVGWKVKEDNISATSSSSVEADLNHIRSKRNFAAFEPAILFRAGGENFKLQAALSFSNFTESSSFYSAELIETLNASLGISINIKPNKK